MNPVKFSEVLLTETQYFPGISVFVMMRSFSIITIDGNENFKKSTLRNRCIIIGANGPLMLTIPIIGGRGVHSKTKDVRIRNGERWQQKHWKSILSAYGKSSFFIFYEEKFRILYEKKFEFLFDFNLKLLEACFEILHWEKKIIIRNEQSNEQNILRDANKEVRFQNLSPYHQVFQARHGFISEVSIVDLLFNVGSEADIYLQKSLPPIASP